MSFGLRSSSQCTRFFSFTSALTCETALLGCWRTPGWRNWYTRQPLEVRVLSPAPHKMPTIRIEHRPLALVEARSLQQALRVEPAVVGYTPSEWMHFRDVWVAVYDGQAAGICITRDLFAGWTEFAMLYVRPHDRSADIGQKLAQAAFDYQIQRKRKLYAVSRNPTVWWFLSQRGFKKVSSFFRLPVEVQWHAVNFSLRPFRIREFFRKRRKLIKQPPYLYWIWDR
jgi:GNAT superfamily N-acetyltransferase